MTLDVRRIRGVPPLLSHWNENEIFTGGAPGAESDLSNRNSLAKKVSDHSPIDLGRAHAARANVALVRHARVRVIEQGAGKMRRAAAEDCCGGCCRGAEEMGRDIDANRLERDLGDQAAKILLGH
jgi:hypothetical protein